MRRLHSPRSAATWREIFRRVLDAPKNERRSFAGEPRRKRSIARRTASAREIFSLRQNSASFLICSFGKSTIVRTMISSRVIIPSQAERRRPPAFQARSSSMRSIATAIRFGDCGQSPLPTKSTQAFDTNASTTALVAVLVSSTGATRKLVPAARRAHPQSRRC